MTVPDVAPRFSPGGRLGWLSAAALPLALFDGGLVSLAAIAAYDAGLLLFAGFESRSLGRRVPVVQRYIASRLVVGQWNRIAIRLHNASSRSVRVTVRDELPAGWTADLEELHIEIPPFARREITYTARPPLRGQFRFGDIHVRLDGVAGLGASIVRVPAADDVNVYPNIRGPRLYDLTSRIGAVAAMGSKKVRKPGGGGEFEQLREYVPGDSYRDLDWKSTAKRHRPVTRTYQHERSQHVLIALDAGRMMATELDELSKLDHAINAALLLAYVALKNGDYVGLVVFADEVSTFVPPARGTGQYRKLLDALFDVMPEPTFADFRRLVEFCRTRISRRSLVVLFSDLLDETQAMPLAEHSAVLRKKHVPICVTMTDAVATRTASQDVAHADDVYARAAAADLLAEQETVKAHLRKSAVGLVEAPPGELAVATVNRYLEVKKYL